MRSKITCNPHVIREVTCWTAFIWWFGRWCGDLAGDVGRTGSQISRIIHQAMKVRIEPMKSGAWQARADRTLLSLAPFILECKTTLTSKDIDFHQAVKDYLYNVWRSTWSAGSNANSIISHSKRTIIFIYFRKCSSIFGFCFQNDLTL